MTASDLLLVFNLFVLESLLSIDNVAVLAIVVKDLPIRDQPKALKYGILGALVFRGLCLFFASMIFKIVWLKLVGGAYLLYLTYGHFSPKKDTIEEGVDKEHNKIYTHLIKLFGAFWSTIILVEIMDLAFSIDNIFAAVAMTKNLYLIITGVAIGIISMRFVAEWFTILIRKFPTLETSAFVVIGFLGLKLIFSGAVDYSSWMKAKELLASHTFDLIFSAIMMLIFFIPTWQKNQSLQA